MDTVQILQSAVPDRDDDKYIRALFVEHADGKDHLTFKEMHSALEPLHGTGGTPTGLYNLCMALDDDRSGTIEYTEFLSYFKDQPQVKCRHFCLT